MKELVLIDLSSIAHPIWHQVQSDPDVNRTSTQTVARVRALASGHEHVAVCCDSGRSFRKEIDPSYKANRPERDEALHHQIRLARERLAEDGFPVWAVQGFEADDLIATATARGIEAGADVLIVSSDKDLLQLVGPKVRARSVATSTVVDEAGVVEKFGVRADQMRDYLTLVGDASDNVKGAKGIGPKTAVALLARFGSLDALYAEMDRVAPPDMGVTPSVHASLTEFRTRMEVTRSLIAMRQDAPIPFEEVDADRVAADAATFGMEDDMEEQEQEATERAVLDEAPPQPTPAPRPELVPEAKASTALTVRAEDVLAPAPAEYERQLDPRSMRDARTLAEDMFKSRLFSAYGTPHGVLSTVMVGRELGLPAMASLRSIHVVEGRHALSAALMGALILKSGMAEYFRPVTDENGTLDADDKHATFETLRKGPGNRPVRFTFTIEEAKAAGLVKEKSGWVKYPKQMLLARAESLLARLVYPDLMAGLYTPEEIAEIRDSEAA